ncbi:hypothetical protein PAPYR_2830 [Paratrimastix pyriformis]|uniref:Uncharacterized protein n=1 Tax=Paratrimastix pyriformis TaxID=342808 RepID=A0ABQ8UP77_9EUKA|nr:hypothetical protein PAPYR_2830 [Paratrimastix pyriformis]
MSTTSPTLSPPKFLGPVKEHSWAPLDCDPNRMQFLRCDRLGIAGTALFCDQRCLDLAARLPKRKIRHLQGPFLIAFLLADKPSPVTAPMSLVISIFLQMLPALLGLAPIRWEPWAEAHVPVWDQVYYLRNSEKLAMLQEQQLDLDHALVIVDEVDAHTSLTRLLDLANHAIVIVGCSHWAFEPADTVNFKTCYYHLPASFSWPDFWRFFVPDEAVAIPPAPDPQPPSSPARLEASADGALVDTLRGLYLYSGGVVDIAQRIGALPLGQPPLASGYAREVIEEMQRYLRPDCPAALDRILQMLDSGHPLLLGPNPELAGLDPRFFEWELPAPSAFAAAQPNRRCACPFFYQLFQEAVRTLPVRLTRRDLAKIDEGWPIDDNGRREMLGLLWARHIQWLPKFLALVPDFPAGTDDIACKPIEDFVHEGYPFPRDTIPSRLHLVPQGRAAVDAIRVYLLPGPVGAPPVLSVIGDKVLMATPPHKDTNATAALEWIVGEGAALVSTIQERLRGQPFTTRRLLVFHGTQPQPSMAPRHAGVWSGLSQAAYGALGADAGAGAGEWEVYYQSLTPYFLNQPRIDRSPPERPLATRLHIFPECLPWPPH